MRLCSQVVLIGLIAVLLAAGCYPHRGTAREPTPDQLLELAEDACRRRDPAASQMLLERLARRHPDTDQGQRARRLLDAPHEAKPGCYDASASPEIRD